MYSIRTDMLHRIVFLLQQRISASFKSLSIKTTTFYGFLFSIPFSILFSTVPPISKTNKHNIILTLWFWIFIFGWLYQEPKIYTPGLVLIIQIKICECMTIYQHNFVVYYNSSSNRRKLSSALKKLYSYKNTKSFITNKFSLVWESAVSFIKFFVNWKLYGNSYEWYHLVPSGTLQHPPAPFSTLQHPPAPSSTLQHPPAPSSTL